jgi:hypothetical protein
LDTEWITSRISCPLAKECSKGALKNQDAQMRVCMRTPPSKSAPPKGACKTNNIKFRSTLFGGHRFLAPSRRHLWSQLVSRSRSVTVFGGESGCE